MHIIKNKLFTIILLTLIGLKGYSQTLKINEYSCANVSGTGVYQDAFGDTPDWFEIYNSSASPRNIQGFYVSDDPTFIGKWQFPIGTTVPAQGFLLVYASGRDTVIAGAPIQYHTNFDLLQTKPEKIILANNAGIIQDSVTIRRHKHNDAWARIPNGSSTWRVYSHDQTNNPTSTPGASNTGVKNYSGYMPSPVFSLERGFYSGSQQLSLSTGGSVTAYDPEIYYTGSGPLAAYIGRDPSIGGNTNPYRQQFLGPPIAVDSSIIIRAYVDTTDELPVPGLNLLKLLPSFVETYSYIIDNSGLPTNFSLPVVSMAYDSSAVGVYPGAGFGGDPSTYMLSLEYFDKNKNFKFSSIGSGTPGSADNNLIPLYYSGFNFAANDEYGYNYTNKQEFYTDANLGTSTRTEQTNIQFKIAGDDSYPYQLATNTLFSTHFRDALCQTYAMKGGLELDGSHYQPCIMYLNGEYRGIFEIREAFDDEYTKHYYGVTGAQSLERDGGLSGTPTADAAYDWGNMVSFITQSDMSNDSLLSLADSMLNFKSLIDLIIYNGYTVNAGFPTKAAWWRYPDTLTNAIKWRYRMFDMDDTYGLNKNDAALVNTGFDASVCQHEAQYELTTDSSMAHLAIFNSLMVSDTFKSQFINRYSYLLNNTLKCDPIVAQLTYIRNLLAPDMVLHCDTLGGGVYDDTLWNIAVDTMKYFIKQRCGTLTEDIKTCYNVTGPFSFCTEMEPTVGGSVTLNTVNYPEAHTDSYFGNVYFNAIAIPSANYYFDHWEPTGFTLPASTLTSDSIQWKFDSVSCLKAVFRLREPYNLTGEPSVPTGFSPNGDGNNDVMNVYGTIDAVEYHMEVYNRWGQKLYETTDKTKGWDGTYNGQDAPVGVYAYVFRITTTDGKQLQKSGNITLIR